MNMRSYCRGKFGSKEQGVHPVVYHIRVKGILNPKWTDWFQGFAMSTRENGETLLSGPVSDQAELFGILGKINGLGLPLLMLVEANYPCPERKCSRCGQCQICAARYQANGKLPYCFRADTKWDQQIHRIIQMKEK